MPAPVEPLVYRVSQVAKMLNVCERAIRRRIETGELKHHRNGRLVLIPASEVRRFLNPEPRRELSLYTKVLLARAGDPELSSLSPSD